MFVTPEGTAKMIDIQTPKDVTYMQKTDKRYVTFAIPECYRVKSKQTRSDDDHTAYHARTVRPAVNKQDTSYCYNHKWVLNYLAAIIFICLMINIVSIIANLIENNNNTPHPHHEPVDECKYPAIYILSAFLMATDMFTVVALKYPALTSNTIFQMISRCVLSIIIIVMYYPSISKCWDYRGEMGFQGTLYGYNVVYNSIITIVFLINAPIMICS